ncbi:MAG: carboxymuconolactone decarboxylase family protein [Bacteroidota bacterium]
MNNMISLPARRIILLIPIILLCMSLSAQEKSDYAKAKADIVQTFGLFPSMFEAFPQHALSGAWENFKQLHSPDNKIPPKYRELIQLAVASQVPCEYCIYFHAASARMFGASEDEIKEAVAQGATSRHWSIVLKGNQVDFEEFKKEFHAMMDYMAKNQSE